MLLALRPRSGIVNASVTDVFETQRQLEKEARALQVVPSHPYTPIFAQERRAVPCCRPLQANTQKLAKQTTQWLQLISQFNTALKVRAHLKRADAARAATTQRCC
jgi:hypothetical protein